MKLKKYSRGLTELFMPWWYIESSRVLQITKSAHCTMTIDMNAAVWP